MTSVSLRGLTLLAVVAYFCLWMAAEVGASGHRARRDDKPADAFITDETGGVDPEVSEKNDLRIVGVGM